MLIKNAFSFIVEEKNSSPFRLYFVRGDVCKDMCGGCRTTLSESHQDNSKRSRTRQMGRVHFSFFFLTLSTRACTRALLGIFAAGKRARSSE